MVRYYNTSIRGSGIREKTSTCKDSVDKSHYMLLCHWNVQCLS